MSGFQKVVPQQFRDRQPVVFLIRKTAAHRMSSRIWYRDLLRVHDSAILRISDLANSPLGEVDDMLTGPDDLHLDHGSSRHAVEWRIAVDHLVENAA